MTTTERLDTSAIQGVPEQAPAVMHEAHDGAYPPLSPKESAAIDRAVASFIGDPRHQSHKDTGARGAVVDIGVTGGINDPNGYLDYYADQQSGTLVLAEGTGSPVGVTAAMQTIERAMQINGGPRPRDLSAALGELRRATAKIPRVISDVRSSLGEDAPDMDATPLAAQIVDNRIIYAGSRPLFVFRPDGTCVRLISGSTPERLSSGVHYMESGRNIIIMAAGREADDDWQAAEMAQNIIWILEDKEDNPDNAQTLAERLHERLSYHEYDGTMLVSVVDVAEWQDNRSVLRRRSSLAVRWPSVGAEWLLTKTVFRGRRQRELHETNSRAGRIGRAAAFAGDVVTNAALVGAIINIGSHIPAVRNAVGASLSWIEHWLPADTGKPSLAPAGTPHPPTSQASNHTPDTSAATPAPGRTPVTAPPTPDTYGDTRVGDSHDSTAHGGPSTVTNWSQDALYHSAIKAGLSPSQATTLSHNQTAINQVNNAFLHDTGNPNNAKVLHDTHTWVNAHDSYSGVAQGNKSDDLALAYRHELGLDLAPVSPVVPPAQPAQPATGNIPIPATVNIPTNRRPDIPDWALLAAGGIGATGLGALAVARLKRRSRRRKKNREQDSQASVLNGARAIRSHRAPRGRNKRRIAEISNKTHDNTELTAAALLGPPLGNTPEYTSLAVDHKHDIPRPAGPSEIIEEGDSLLDNIP